MAQPVPVGQGGRHFPLLPANGLPGDRRHIDEAQKDIQLSRYRDLSDACKGMILVPGTIAWRKPLDRSGWDEFHRRGLATCLSWHAGFTTDTTAARRLPGSMTVPGQAAYAWEATDGRCMALE
jgi:hypothetical protein